MIRLENICKRFPGSKEHAVDNLSLEVKEGEVCVLVGPSGCGKTTTMKMINRLCEPDSGTIHINGQNIAKRNPIMLRRDIGYVIQEIGLFPHLTIEQNIATVPQEKKWPKDKIIERTKEMMKLIGLEPEIYSKRYPSALSGGQRQRVGVARALASDPPILLMDEPFAAVDPITRARLQSEFLRILQKLNKTIVFVTHDIDEAIKMADTIAVLRKGVLIQHTTPSQLLTAPANEFVAKLVGKNRSIKRLHLTKVREILNGNSDAIQLKAPFAEIQKRLEIEKTKTLMVVDEHTKLHGVIGQSNFKEGSGKIAADFCSDLPDTITDDATLNDTLSVMLETGEGYVAVVDDEQRYQGTITLGDLLNVVKEEGDLLVT